VIIELNMYPVSWLNRKERLRNTSLQVQGNCCL